MSCIGTIIPITLREANDFVEQHHRHSARTSNDGGKFAIGLRVKGELVGVAIVGRPVARLLQRDPLTAELLRVCVSPDAPRTANSMLYGRACRIWQAMGGRKLVSYTLKRESGASLRGAGFVAAAEVKAEAWSRPSRQRTAKAIETEPKIRWERELPA